MIIVMIMITTATTTATVICGWKDTVGPFDASAPILV